jgi:hypothetical protein
MKTQIRPTDKPAKPTSTVRRTGLGIWTIAQTALELSKNESGQPDIERFEKYLPRVLEALIKTEDLIIKHYGTVANGTPEALKE